MSKSNYLEDALLNWIRGTAFPAAPGAVYVSLHTADPGETGTSEHGATAAYTRVAAAFGAPSNGVIANSAIVDFPQATVNYSAPITHFGLWTGQSGGNFLGGSSLGAPRTITAGATPRFGPGTLTWTED